MLRSNPIKKSFNWFGNYVAAIVVFAGLEILFRQVAQGSTQPSELLRPPKVAIKLGDMTQKLFLASDVNGIETRRVIVRGPIK